MEVEWAKIFVHLEMINNDIQKGVDLVYGEDDVS
jgi:hypothetical protein